MGRRGKIRTATRPKHVVVDTDKRGNQRLYYRQPGARKIRLRGPLLSKDFWHDYEAACAGQLKPRQKFVSKSIIPPKGTFARLITDYYHCADFLSLSRDTRYRRRLVLDPLREQYGKLPAKDMTAKHIRILRDKNPDKPESGNAIVKALRQLLKFGVEYGYISHNPARDVSMRKRNNSKGYHTWTKDELEKYRTCWAVGTRQRLAFDLMLYTGVRRGDAILIGPHHCVDNRLEFIPGKTSTITGRRLSIPIHPDLATSIEATPICDQAFLITQYDKPWGGPASFGNVFRDWCNQAGLKHCSAHGLRKAAAVMLIEAGCSAAEAAAITGHDSLQMLEYYARERDRGPLATTAMSKVIAQEKSNKNVPLDKGVPNRGTMPPFNQLKIKENINDWLPEQDSNL